jgi:hypothetical protein
MLVLIQKNSKKFMGGEEVVRSTRLLKVMARTVQKNVTALRSIHVELSTVSVTVSE